MQPVSHPRAARRRSAESTSSEHTFVFFDLETTGLDVSECDIIQLSAVCGPRTFNVYVVPGRSITPGASMVTGFSVRDGVLFRHGLPMETVSLHQALTKFLSFLHCLNRPVLVAHNGFRFDSPVLVRALRKFSLHHDLKRVSLAFLDTYLLCRDILALTGIRKFSQKYLYNHFLKKSYEVHNALEDVKALQELFYFLNPTRMQAQKHMLPISDF